MAARERAAESESAALAGDQKLTFHYIKSSQFRVMHIDGVHGGVTPRALIQMALFSERLPIPQTETFAVSKEGLLGGLEAHGRVGLIREVEAEAILDVTTARVIVAWLAHQIELAEARIAEAQPNQEQAK